MNAIPQRTHNYERIQLPRTPAIERTRPMAKIEYLDERRAAKLAAAKRQEMAEKIRRDSSAEVQDERVRPQRYQHVDVPQRESAPRVGSAPRSLGTGRSATAARKLTAAYEVRPRYAGYGAYRDYDLDAGGAVVRRPAVPGFDMNAYDEEDAYARQVAIEYKAPRKKGVVSTILSIVLVFAMLTGVLVKYAELSGVTHQNAQLEKSIASLEEDLGKVKMDIALNEDLGNIQQRAQALGMSHPTEDQIQYVTFEEEAPAAADAVNTITAASTGELIGGTDGTAAAGSAADTGGAFERVKDFFGNIADTIKGWLGQP